MTDTLPPPDGLPELPPPAYGWNNDYYDGWSYEETPQLRWHELLLFTAEQMTAYALAAVALERERCAVLCETVAAQYENHTVHDDWPDPEVVTDQCAAAIRKGTA